MRLSLLCLSLLVLCFSAGPVWAQNSDTKYCGSSEMRDRLIKMYPQLLEQEASLEKATQQYIRTHANQINDEKSTGPIILPLVFHIINEGGPENISDAQVLDEVRIMNEDYNKLNSDTANVTDTILKAVIANMGVQWRLANIDPNGHCTNGIDRVTSDQTWWGDDNSKLDDWPDDKYVNVWLVQVISNGAAGYAYFPSEIGSGAFAVSPAFDGVLLLSNYTGSIGTGSAFTSRALTHEIGHCFNLEHTWGNGQVATTCGDDGVNDTPITKGWIYCPSPAESKVCDTAIMENYQNFMEYSYCSCMFTNGQKARWLAAANSTQAGRNNLWSPSNLVATGTADTSRNPCAPVADFTVNNHYVCAGDSIVKFISTSGNGDINTYYWQFPTGSPSTSTDSVVTVKFTQQGWQRAILTVSNGLGSSTKSDSLLVFVGGTIPAVVAPYYEGFDDPNIFNENTWAAINYEAGNAFGDNTVQFTQVTTAAHTGTGSAMLNNWDAIATHDIDEIVSPGIDLQGLSNAQMTLSFYYSIATATQFQQFLGTPPDSIVVYANTNCSNTWQVIYRNGGSETFVNAGYDGSPYVPQSASDWQKVSITLPGTLKQPDVKFMFRVFTTVGGSTGETGEGNNFYIDDINIGNAPVPTGINGPATLSATSLYPNPTSGEATLALNLAQAGNVTVKVYDISGKQLLTAYNGFMNTGKTQVAIPARQLAAGVYLVNIVAGESVMQQKLIVQ